MTATITAPPTVDPLVPPQSEDTKNIAAAIARVQGTIGKVVKTKTGSITTKSGASYSFAYADLTSIIDLSHELLAEHGVSVNARSIPAQGGIRVQTVLRHSSGEWLADGAPFLPVVAKDHVDPKAYGIAISYLRRYGLAAMLNIAQSDNEDELSRSARPAAKKQPATKLAPVDGRDALLARIQALPEELRGQIASKLKESNVVWTQISVAQLKTATDWTVECEGLAEAEA